MAISARQASLMNQRNRTPYSSGGTLRILTPTSTGISTIAKNNAKAELETMIRRYNDGLIGNDDMKDFLNRQLGVPGLSQLEKVDIQDQIRDFDTLVRKDALEAAFKSAPEYSLEKIQAAQALTSFYKDRAATMSPGTPAQSQALENAGIWDQRVVDLNQAVEKKQRQNLRYISEQNINQIPSGTSDRALAKSQMFEKLAQEALADGDTVEYNRFLSYSQNEQTNMQSLFTREQERMTKDEAKAQKDEILSWFGQMENDYHDGKIDENTYLQLLSQSSALIDATGDYALINRLNRITDTVQKNLDRGGLRRMTTASGLPSVVGKGPAGGKTTDWDIEDYNYSDNLRKTEEAFRNAQIDGNTYSQMVGEILTERQKQINSRIDTLEAKATEDPNMSVMYQGKKQRAVDILNKVYQQDDELAPQIQAYQDGNFNLMEIAPDATKGKNSVEYKLIDPRLIPQDKQDQYVVDTDGIIHSVTRSQINLTEEQINNYVSGGFYNDPESGQSFPVKPDSAGNLYIYGAAKVDMFDPNTNQRTTVDYVDGQPLEGLSAKVNRLAEEARTNVQNVKNAEVVQTGTKDVPQGISFGKPQGAIPGQPEVKTTLTKPTGELTEGLRMDQQGSTPVTPPQTPGVQQIGETEQEKQVVQRAIAPPQNLSLNQLPTGLTVPQKQPLTVLNPKSTPLPTISQTPQANLTLPTPAAPQTQAGLTYLNQPAKSVAPPPVKAVLQPGLGTKIVNTIQKPISWLGKKTGWW